MQDAQGLEKPWPVRRLKDAGLALVAADLHHAPTGGCCPRADRIFLRLRPVTQCLVGRADADVRDNPMHCQLLPGERPTVRVHLYGLSSDPETAAGCRETRLP